MARIIFRLSIYRHWRTATMHAAVASYVVSVYYWQVSSRKRFKASFLHDGMSGICPHTSVPEEMWFKSGIWWEFTGTKPRHCATFVRQLTHIYLLIMGYALDFVDLRWKDYCIRFWWNGSLMQLYFAVFRTNAYFSLTKTTFGYFQLKTEYSGNVTYYEWLDKMVEAHFR